MNKPILHFLFLPDYSEGVLVKLCHPANDVKKTFILSLHLGINFRVFKNVNLGYV